MLPSAYESQKYEDAIYKKWEQSGAFRAKVNPKKKPFTISMPPPNATGTLHLGHAVMLAIEDILIRHRRMKGYEALWLPGTDHAAIATQNKVEKLIAEEGLTRQKLGRENFLDRVREYVADSQDVIRNQIRKMGSSCDWSRERYTFDDDLNKAVTEIFVRMYEDGLIYRGYRIVNWCPRCKSTLADDEVEHEEIEGNFYHILYPFKGEKNGLIVATTRPETMLGDTAVAVNPKDKRFKKYIGKTMILPLMKKEIMVIGDSYVDMKTGTGALKVTPAHDPNDFEIGKRHKLEVIRVMDDEARINEHGGKYKGLDRFTARDEVLKDLKKLKLLKKIESRPHSVGHCYRCSTIVEPLTSDQWFIDVNKKIKNKKTRPPEPALSRAEGKGDQGGFSLKDLAIHVVKNGNIKIIPDRFNKTYFHWMENLRDWCISRQIWWGHRIPVWYCVGDDHCVPDCKKPIVSRDTPKKCPACGSKNLRQDEDTLDTWFSSGLWTFSTLGWPKETADLKYFHPTSVMETGYDILFFWIARMILMTTYATGQIPFETVYLHGLIRDREGRKMSKSLGNGIDPIEMIKKYGADALRLSMVIGNTPGNDMRLYEEKIQGYRNFINKLWNASRFVLGVPVETRHGASTQTPKPLSDADEWILEKLSRVITTVGKHLENYAISEAGQLLYDFLWSDFCDWYLELSKGEKQSPAVLHHVLKTILILLHPFVPFVTEEIWAHLPGTDGLLINAPWPAPVGPRHGAALSGDGHAIDTVIGVVTKIRQMRAENKIDPVKKITVVLHAHSHFKALRRNQAEVMRLARLSELTLVEKDAKVANATADTHETIKIFIPFAGLVDAGQERERLQKEIAKLEGYIAGLSKKLGNPGFAQNAPKEIVELERKKQQEAEGKVAKMIEQLNQLK
ncbi:valine--tRNA ligase [Candidatus Peregrinibacteria bacterium]|nr:valine--tRNA ligase [Candidatus Peregrinibacteria bacterium]